MRTFEAFADALVSEGVEVVFGLLGGGNAGLIWELRQRGVTFVASRHEQGAVGMADGYSRATGRLGVASVSHGPGLTNAATPLITARLSRSRVLVVTSDIAADDRHSNMRIDQSSFISATAGFNAHLASPALLTETLELALRHIRSGAGIAVVNTPDDVIRAPIDPEHAYRPTGLAELPDRPVPPHPLDVEIVADLLDDAERPLLLAGRGAVRAGARQALLDLAERWNVPIGTTLLAKSLFAGHPLDVGVCGGFAGADVAAITRRADLVITFGASLSLETAAGGLTQDAVVVQVDTDPVMARDQVQADHVLRADARLMAEALASVRTSSVTGWGDATELRELVASIDPLRGIDLDEQAPHLNPYRAYRALDEILPADRVLLVDGGYFMGGPVMHLSVSEPGDLVLPWRFGAIGGSIGPALGAAVGRPDRQVVVVTGDGGLMMNLQELDTASRYGLSLLVIVIDNEGFAMERPYYVRKGWDPAMADYRNPDFAAVAVSLGYDALTPDSTEHLVEWLRPRLPLRRPTLVNLRVGQDAAYHEIDRWSEIHEAG